MSSNHYQIIGAANAADLAVGTIRKKFSMKDCPIFSLHYEWTKVGATGATATITLWGSNKPDPGESADTDWVDITTETGLTFTAPADNTGKHSVTVKDTGYLWYMLKVVTASGTSTMKCWVYGKASAR
jgi:hypothetical protein